ncbi:hypothetical protein EDB89DRAFT_331228 [Lactarius sanguifluus]|nr:hypothetical protein EDB89DRAFT_331228 [Lactarius sanguifluus]
MPFHSSPPRPSPTSRRRHACEGQKHTWSAVPSDWKTLDGPSAGTTIDLYIVLNPHQESALIDALSYTRPATPSVQGTSNSPLLLSRLRSRVPLLRFRYGAHLYREKVAKLVGPHPETLELFTSWFVHHGV